MNHYAGISVLERIDAEIAHYYDIVNSDFLFSKCNKFWGKVNQQEFSFTLSLSPALLGVKSFRLVRRALRIDKSNAVFNMARDGVVVIYQGNVYYYDLNLFQLRAVGRLRQSRNVPHGGICVTSEGIFFGEYGANPDRQTVPVWGSDDGGRNWRVMYEFPAGIIKHVHGIYKDPFSESLWITTGDFQGECFLVEICDQNFSNVIFYGNGQQEWRAVTPLFTSETIYLPMDSPKQTSVLQLFDRSTKKLTSGEAFPGPVWYAKQFGDGTAVYQSSVEVGPGVTSPYASLMYSSDLVSWETVADFKKDMFPFRLFKFGVIAFAEGNQSPHEFLIHGEAVKGIDGKVFRVRINDI